MEYQKGLVSIIVPVYNTDPFLMKKCINSLIRQTYKNIEIIIVNDGSTESETVSYLKQLKDIERIRIINKRNGGVSSARNMGLKKSEGEYVFFLDSDDYIDDNLIEKMHKAINNKNYIAVVAKMITVINGKEYPALIMDNRAIDAKKDFKLIITNTVHFASQGILYRSRIAKRHQFNCDLKYGEDQLYGLETLSEGVSFYSNEGAYYYVQNKNSTIYDIKGLEKYLENYKYIYEKLLKTDSSRIRILSFMMCDKIILQLYRHQIKNKLSFSQYRKKAQYYRKYLISEKALRVGKGIGVFRKMLVGTYLCKAYLINYMLIKIRLARWKARNI